MPRAKDQSPLISNLTDEDRVTANALMSDIQELYSLKSTIANLRIIESKLASAISEQGFQADQLGKLLAVERTLTRTIKTAIEIEKDIGSLISAKSLANYMNLIGSWLTNYIHDDVERQRFILEMEHQLAQLKNMDIEAKNK